MIAHGNEAPPGRFTAASQLRRLDGFDLEIIDRPAATLGQAAVPVLEALTRLARENLASDPASFVEGHFQGATTLIAVRLAGELVGMSVASAFEAAGNRYLWVRATILDPRARGAMFMQRVTGVHVWRAARAAWPGRFFLMTRTGNPRVVGSLVAAPQFFPRPGRATPARLREAAIAFCRAQGCEATFDAEAMVLRNAVAQADDEQGPPHRDPRINDFCRARLVSGGDRLLMVAHVGLLAVAASSLATAVRGRWMRSREPRL